MPWYSPTAMRSCCRHLKRMRRCLFAAAVLPEEGGPPKLSIQEMVKLEDARVDLPSLISIRIWLKDDGVDREGQRLERTVRAEARRRRRFACDSRSRVTFPSLWMSRHKVRAGSRIPGGIGKDLRTRIDGNFGK